MATRVLYKTVEPVRPAAGYIGGKKQLAKTIIAAIEKIQHDTYAEPFVGMGGVFLRRRRAPRAEIINDRSGDVATFFRILQRHYVPFMDMLRWQLTGLERAARFLYLQRTAFGGKVAGRNFGVDPLGGRFNVTKLMPLLDELHDRLAGVVIECLPWAEFVGRYDRPGTLFYLDPPYFGGESDYGVGLFDRAEYEKMAEVLGRIQGRFILSLNDVPAIRRAFKSFSLKPVKLTSSVSGGNGRPVGELIITSRSRRG